MALAIFTDKWNGKKAIAITAAEALKIKQQLLDMPNDLSEQRYDFLKAVSHVLFGDGTRFPLETKKPARWAENVLHEGVYQSRDMGVPNNDR